MFEDSRKNFWVTYWSDFLYRRDPVTSKFKRYELKFPVAELPVHRASEICEDKYGRLWVGSANGIYFTDIIKKQIEPFKDKLAITANSADVAQWVLGAMHFRRRALFWDQKKSQ